MPTGCWTCPTVRTPLKLQRDADGCGSSCVPRMTTREAGRFTPAASVVVATSTSNTYGPSRWDSA